MVMKREESESDSWSQVQQPDLTDFPTGPELGIP